MLQNSGFREHGLDFPLGRHLGNGEAEALCGSGNFHRATQWGIDGVWFKPGPSVCPDVHTLCLFCDPHNQCLPPNSKVSLSCVFMLEGMRFTKQLSVLAFPWRLKPNCEKRVRYTQFSRRIGTIKIKWCVYMVPFLFLGSEWRRNNVEKVLWAEAGTY